MPFEGTARDALESCGSTLIFRDGFEGRREAEGERAFEPGETKGILEEERRPKRAGSWGSPRVKASLAGSVIMRGTSNACGEQGGGGEEREDGGDDEGERKRKRKRAGQAPSAQPRCGGARALGRPHTTHSGKKTGMVYNATQKRTRARKITSS